MAVEHDLDHYASQIDNLVGRLDTLIEQQAARNTITVTHTQEGMSAWTAAAVCACFATWFGLILIMFDLHDLRAWSDIYRQRINTLENAHQGAKP